VVQTDQYQAGDAKIEEDAEPTALGAASHVDHVEEQRVGQHGAGQPCVGLDNAAASKVEQSHAGGSVTKVVTTDNCNCARDPPGDVPDPRREDQAQSAIPSRIRRVWKWTRTHGPKACKLAMAVYDFFRELE
jgi:hypothetical protein